MDTETIQKTILKDGAFIAGDPEIGNLVDMFTNNNYPFQTEEGLRFLQAILADKVRNPKDVRTYLTHCSVLEKQLNPYSSDLVSACSKHLGLIEAPPALC
jgi:hypothetical protein